MILPKLMPQAFIVITTFNRFYYEILAKVPGIIWCLIYTTHGCSHALSKSSFLDLTVKLSKVPTLSLKGACGIAETPVSPVPYDVNPLMDLNTRIKVLARRITIHLSEIPRGKVSTPIHLQIRQFIGQDLAALEDCFDTQQEFSACTLHHFKLFFCCGRKGICTEA
jgi:hypothetical protein